MKKSRKSQITEKTETSTLILRIAGVPLLLISAVLNFRYVEQNVD